MSWVYQTCDLKLQCDPMSSSTCGLGDYCICKTGTSYDFTNNVCVPVGTAIATLTPNCVTDNDCNGTFSANCINSECTCPNGMLAANNICPPAPLFNINGGCINTTLVWFPNENICRIPRLNEACPTGLCATSAMTCSSNGICTAPAMNENCNGICADPAATCLNGVCSCQQYFVYDSATKQCVETPMNAGMPCSPVQHLCNNTILTSGGVTSTITVTCDLTSMMCTCPVGFTVVKNQCATASACPGDSCAHNETCTNKAKCLNGICQCPLGLGWNPGVFGACGSCQTGKIELKTIANT